MLANLTLTQPHQALQATAGGDRSICGAESKVSPVQHLQRKYSTAYGHTTTLFLLIFSTVTAAILIWAKVKRRDSTIPPADESKAVTPVSHASHAVRSNQEAHLFLKQAALLLFCTDCILWQHHGVSWSLCRHICSWHVAHFAKHAGVCHIVAPASWLVMWQWRLTHYDWSRLACFICKRVEGG